MTANTAGGFARRLEHFKYNNWQDNACAVMPTNGVCAPAANAGTAISILTPGYRSPNYNVGLIGAALKVKW